MKKCPYCGHEVKDDATKCDKCYAGIPNEESKQVEKSEHERVSRRKTRS